MVAQVSEGGSRHGFSYGSLCCFGSPWAIIVSRGPIVGEQSYVLKQGGEAWGGAWCVIRFEAARAPCRHARSHRVHSQEYLQRLAPHSAPAQPGAPQGQQIQHVAVQPPRFTAQACGLHQPGAVSGQYQNTVFHISSKSSVVRRSPTRRARHGQSLLACGPATPGAGALFGISASPNASERD
ncbi:hypothetical protein NDU88_000133 [Pleurodeles waltl]|uniref:Uncharacterized protein n=1 Tax=Pleurodeles waltl TaxID=8319 RepID=A0AAV7KLP3_PLEWA|nr:hypothetical protein NDU88_000133 [Pleurodeles waltl]